MIRDLVQGACTAFGAVLAGHFTYISPTPLAFVNPIMASVLVAFMVGALIFMNFQNIR